ncbi:MAG: S8 family serine peptidase [Bdellovibrio sp.]|nr:S8 family serine peptidase [Bdellovibrio sp.]
MWNGRPLFSFLFIFSFIFTTSYISAQSETETDNTEDVVYLIKTKKEMTLSDLNEILDKHGFKVKKHFKQINVTVAAHNNPQQVQGFKDEQKDKIVYMEIDAPVSIVKTPNDKLFQEQDSLHRLGIERAWDVTTGSFKVIIAVSDTGIYALHEDLANQIWTNFKEIPNNAKDDDGNGFVDDVSGWNFITSTGRPTDDHGHGTHVSGIIGAEGNNNYGVSGVNWDVLVMPLKFLDKNGSGTTSGGISTILYAADNGAKVLNASWGSSSNSAALKDAIDYGYSKGMLTIAAAGNNAANSDKEPIYPAGTDSDGVIAIASSSADGELSSFSNFGGTSVHLAAPGSNVLSTYLNNTFKRMSGTSMATPMASGVAGLFLAVDPTLTALELRNALLNSVAIRTSYDGLLITEGDLDPSVTLGQMNEEFKIWPHQVNINNGDSFQFAALKARGQVVWKLSGKKDRKLASIDQNGRLTTVQGKSGVLTVSATDEQGHEAFTGTITVVNAGGNRGGGCTKEAYAAGAMENQHNSKAQYLLGYIFLIGLILAYKKLKKNFF